MRLIWLSIIFIVVNFNDINGDTYHYRVLRKICPSGTYHDPIRDKCRRVPGGGEVVKFNLEAKCSKGFTGLLPYEKKSRYYYVCKSDAVLTCACKPKEIFNRIRLRCEGKKDESRGNNSIREKYTDTVVDNIMEKYKCTIMNGHYQNGECWMPTTEQYVTYQSAETNRPDPSQLRSLLYYIRTLQTLANSESRDESYESKTEPPQVINVRYEDPPTTTATYEYVKPKISPPKPSQSKPKTPQKPAEIELEELKKLWGFTDGSEKKENPVIVTVDVKTKNRKVVVPETTTIEPEKTTIQPETTTEFMESEIKSTTVINDYPTTILPSITFINPERTQDLQIDSTTADNVEIISTTQKSEDPLTTISPETTTEIISTTVKETTTLEPEKPSTISVTTEKDYDMTQKNSNGDDPYGTTTFSPPTTIRVKTKSTTSRIVRKTKAAGDTDYELNQSPEFIYEFYFEDEPQTVLWTEVIKKNSTQKSNTRSEAPNNEDELPVSPFIDEITTMQPLTERSVQETTTLIIDFSTEKDTSTEGNNLKRIESDTTTMISETSSVKETPTENPYLKRIDTEASTLFPSSNSFPQETTTEIEKILNLETTTTQETTTNFNSRQNDHTEFKTPSLETSTIQGTTLFPQETTFNNFNIDQRDAKENSPSFTTEIPTTTEIIPSMSPLDLRSFDDLRFDTTTNEDLITTSRVELTTNEVVNIQTTSQPIMIPEDLVFSTTTNKIDNETTDKIISEPTTTEQIVNDLQTTTDLPETTTKSEVTTLQSITSSPYPFSTSSKKPENPLYWQDPAKKDAIEYYYEYEDYEVDEHGHPVKKTDEHGNPKKVEKENASHDGKKVIKNRRDNSFEYYVESISASREQRRLEDLLNYED